MPFTKTFNILLSVPLNGEALSYVAMVTEIYKLKKYLVKHIYDIADEHAQALFTSFTIEKLSNGTWINEDNGKSSQLIAQIGKAIEIAEISEQN